jgi:SAM-dependent methyltransferase
LTAAFEPVRVTAGRRDGACPLCGGEASWPLAYDAEAQFERDHGARLRAAGYAWHLCRTCGNGYPTSLPDLDILSAYWARNRDVTDVESEKLVWDTRRRISRIGAERSFRIYSPLFPPRPGRRFLDIACGLGATVGKFADEGWDAQGIDADPAMHRFHQEFCIRSQIGQIETVRIEGKFDLIQVAHAIYFISDPLRFLSLVRGHLAENGILAIVLADFMASDDLSLPGYPHSFFPTASSMRYLLARAGYLVISCRKLSGSIYLAARPGAREVPGVQARMIKLGYETKALRYALFGKPKLAARRLAKRLISLIGRWAPRAQLGE